jgi:DNA-binding transcriptional regulator YhcF (GntR family)
MPQLPESVGLDDLGITIDRHAEVPIGVQLGWALRARIRDGRLQPGRRLPGLRDLAEALGVNANTVRSVYQRLEQEGVIDSQQGSGTFVASAPPRSSAVGTIAANAAREAHETGVDPREVAAALYVAPESGTGPIDGQAGRRRQLRTQITALEQTLAEIQAKHPSLTPETPGSHKGMAPRLLSAQELEEVQAQLVRQLAGVQATLDELGQPKVPTTKQKAATSTKRASRPRATARPAPTGT